MILQIRNNGPAFDQALPLIKFGVDFWYRMCYSGSVSGTSFDSCINEVERYRYCGEYEVDEKESEDSSCSKIIFGGSFVIHVYN